MARKIKFRGKSLNTGIWEYGDLNTLFYNHPRIYTISRKISVDENTVGQFTGLHDKNGKEIYEGDIIRSLNSKGEPIIHHIIYDNEEAGFIAALKGSVKGDFGYGKCYQQWITECKKEVIGNIHDNPELLKQK